VPGGANQLAGETAAAWDRAVAAYRANALQEALKECGALVTRANQYIDQTAPFKLAKDPARAGELDNILYTLAEVCRALGALLWPVMPGTAGKLHRQLGLGSVNTNLLQSPPPLAEGRALGEIFPLFPRKDAE
jgi:methionyl-tRNA synthetase